MGLLSTAVSTATQKTVEHLNRTARSRRHSAKTSERRRLAETFDTRPDLPHIDEKSGYCPLPRGSLAGVDRSANFCQQVWRERGYASVALKKQHQKKQSYRSTILSPRTYEDAPAILDLVLSDEVLAIAVDYLKEIPVLYNIELWATPANEMMAGSQYYHLDGQRWYLRRAKFLFNMNDVAPQGGPFTFLPADVSRRVAETAGRVKGRFQDEEILRAATRDDEVALVGPAGTGAVVDSSRCFHFGARAREGTRLLLMFHFLRIVDMVGGGELRRTAGFRERFGNDPVRNLVVPLEAD